MKSVLNIHWKDWCWSWNSNTLATWCEELTHLKRPQCWERWKAGREGDDRGWDGWMASPTRRTWVWVISGIGDGQGATVHGVTESDTTEWLNWLSPYLLNLNAEYMIWNARLDEAQAEIKNARRNINNLRYVDDTTLTAESTEELKNLLMNVKDDSEKAGLKLNIQKIKMKIMASHPMMS